MNPRSPEGTNSIQSRVILPSISQVLNSEFSSAESCSKTMPQVNDLQQ